MDTKVLPRSSGWRKAFRTSVTDMSPPRRKSSSASNPQNMKAITLEQKYGRPHKILSDEGAGGAIFLVTRRRDNTTFAVKRFNRRQHHEDEQSYTRKIASEHYIGTKLNHCNIIKTLDLFHEHSTWLQVLEYAPSCLFDRVMSRKMSPDEITCAFMQVLSGATYLHRSGFAHRDLKLENVVISDKGIMKIIDFGSATICAEPGRKTATDFVGSLAYMSPEAAAAVPHDPQKADVWSLAIMYSCMILGRFPWKAADHRSNETFALFAGIDSPSSPSLKTALSLQPHPDPPSRASSTTSVTVINVSIVPAAPTPADITDGLQKSSEKEKQRTVTTEKVLGPWGLLRRLPSQSRDVIKAMLTLRPERRPSLEEVMGMQWVRDAVYCAEDEARPGHVHC